MSKLLTKAEKRTALVYRVSQLLMAVQGCTNHGCEFREDEGVKTNAVCRCKHVAHQIVGSIISGLDEPTQKDGEE